MFHKIGDVQLGVFEHIVNMENVGAMWHGDDLAFKNDPIVSPAIYRKYLFPYLEEMGRICRENDLPFIIHSDGDLYELLNDLYSCGFKAIHPVEPDVMDIVELKKKWKGKLCLIGNVNAHIITTGTPKQVKEEVRQLIGQVGSSGVIVSHQVVIFLTLRQLKITKH